jgi:hypothetical protein
MNSRSAPFPAATLAGGALTVPPRPSRIFDATCWLGRRLKAMGMFLIAYTLDGVVVATFMTFPQIALAVLRLALARVP